MKNKLVIRMLTVALISGMAVPQTVLPALAAETTGIEMQEMGTPDPADLADGEYSVEIRMHPWRIMPSIIRPPCLYGTAAIICR